jgi:3-phytase
MSRNKEAREDSAKLALAMQEMEKITNSIFPSFETHPVGERAEEDAADDPAIWFNTADPEKSIVFGTNKRGGIYAYDLQGNELDYYPLGEINNIDIRHDIHVNGSMTDVIGGSNRTDNSLLLYRIDSLGKLRGLLNESLLIDRDDINEVYGFCLYKNNADSLYAIINGKNGKINSYVLKGAPEKSYLEKRHSWKTGTQPEGMVADDQLGILYVGEEQKGIWRIDLTSMAMIGEIELIEDSRKEKNPFIEYDIEGLSIYYGEDADGFLLASIQGSFSYAIFERTHDNNYLGSFTIEGFNALDGAEETDGLDIFSRPIGKDFPHGLLVVQDGFNYDSGKLTSQNFKYIDLQQVLRIWQNFRGKNI